MDQNQVKLGFSPFWQVWFINFCSYSVDNSLELCLLVELKLTETIFETQIWAKRSKIRPKIRVFTSLVFLGIVQDYSLGQCLTSCKTKTSKKKCLTKIRAYEAKIGSEVIFSVLCCRASSWTCLLFIRNTLIRKLRAQEDLKNKDFLRK